MFIEASTGNVGIGTLSPTAKLHVSGDIKANLANVSTSNVVYYDSTTGLMTYGTAPSIFKIDYDYNITGIKNGANTNYSTSSNFITGTTRVYLNGVRLTRGVGYDYIEVSNNQITLDYFPVPSDTLIIEYEQL
jgi:hypothetical protein